MGTFENARRMAGGYADITAADLHPKLADVTIVDVRELDEWNAGHIAEAHHVPLSAWPAAVTQIPAGKPVVLVCHSGGRSARAAAHLGKSGGVDIYNVAGGMMAWVAHKLPVAR